MTFGEFSAKIFAYTSSCVWRISHAALTDFERRCVFYILYTVGLYTLGCKVSQYETEAVGELFETLGFRICPFSELCDVYVINTCTVTAESDAKSRKYIRRAVKTNPNAVVCVMGCYSQRSADDVAAIDGVSVVIGTEKKTELPEIVLDILNRKIKRHVSVTDVTEAEFEPMTVRRAPRTRAYVKIEDGCECKCTYCAIADARGRVRSKHPEDVISEVEALAEGGVREVVLTGIETASYGADFDFKYRLGDLLSELDRRKSCERVRLGSLAPELVGEDFVNAVSDLEILVPHFHLSVQSGSDSVLRAMKRRYNSQMLIKNIERIKERIPGATFTTDLMVGFPGESEEDFLDTLMLVERVGFLDAHVFAYSRRHNTPAALYPCQISEEEKRKRSERLIEAARISKHRVLDGIVEAARELSCILETKKDGFFTAHSDEFAEVIIKDDGFKQGDVVKVRPVSRKDGVILGEALKM